jgi:hypothetical protein
MLRVIVAASLLLAGCECGGGVDLVIDVRSNLIAGVEVDRAVVDVYPEGGRTSIHFSAIDLAFGDPLETAVRLAEIPNVAPGAYQVVVVLERLGAPVATRTIVAEVTTTTVLTVLITRDCAMVQCEEGTSCFAGVCVPNDCGATPRSCPTGMCATDAECTSIHTCASARCLESTCQIFPDHGLCSAGEYCHPEDGCTPLLDTPDAGVGCPMEGCDDANPCTDDTCDGMRCVFTPNEAICDDGVFCNGADRCMAGACAVHPGSPCPGASMCNEAMRACVGCATSADCPPETPGPWGACTFGNDCASSGTQSRTITSYTCVGGTCQASTRNESGPCSRESRENNECGATTCGGYGGCDYSGQCDQSATQERSCTERRCRSGVCADVGTTESRGCSRNTNGMDCGSSCDGWGGCDYTGECDEDATRSRTCHDRICNAGSCRTNDRDEQEPCSRGTEGATCGSNPSYCGQPTSCHICRSGSCEVNTPHFDAACRPSCGAAADMCGTTGMCCPSSATGCARVGDTWDCDVCCESAFCF